jgi:hypothetical protein
MDEASPATLPYRNGCGRLMLWAGLAVLLMGGLLVWSCADLARDGLRWLSLLPGRLSTTQLTESFRESVVAIVSNDGEILEVAVLETDETLSRSDTLRVLGDSLDLGTTVSEIRVPVVYRYHIRLSDAWQLEEQNGRLVVHAPPLRPTLPPAVRTEAMEKRSTAGWLRFNAADNLAALERGLTPALEARAGDSRHLGLVRDKARASVAAFVRRWVLQQEARQVTNPVVQVRFADEPAAVGPAPAP